MKTPETLYVGSFFSFRKYAVLKLKIPLFVIQAESSVELWRGEYFKNEGK